MKIVNEGVEGDISVLGKDLLVEILRRLRCVNSATQCKSVCKLWCSLVDTDPHSHWLGSWCQMNHNIESFTLIIQYREAPATDHCGKEAFNLEFLPCFDGKNPVHVLGSHKDLLLCCPNYSDRSCFYICNPFTKQCTALPPPPRLSFGQRQPFELDLKYYNVCTLVEFIADECAQKFTVVRILPPLFGNKKVQVSIFSSDGGWREMDDDDGWWEKMFKAHRSCKKIVSYKGRMVLLMKDEYLRDFDILYSWDLDSNCIRLLLPTPGYPNWSGKATIGVCEGHLRIVQLRNDCRKLKVYQFDDSQRQDWDFVQELDLNGPGDALNDHSSRFNIGIRDMVFHPHDDGDMLYILVDMISKDGKERSSYIFMCNLKRKRLELMGKLPTKPGSFELFPVWMRCWPTPVPCFNHSG